MYPIFPLDALCTISLLVSTHSLYRAMASERRVLTNNGSGLCNGSLF